MRISIRRMLGIASVLTTAALLMGDANPAWAQRASTDSSAVRPSRGSTDGRAATPQRSRTTLRESARSREASEPTRNAAASRTSRTEDTERPSRGTESGRRPSRVESDSNREGDARSDRSTSVDRRPNAGRPDGTPRVQPRPGYNPPSSARPKPSVRPVPPVRPQPSVHVDVRWPWEHRYRRGWSPTYRYRQVVYVDAGWGRHRRESRLDVRTFYRQRVNSASRNRAQVEIYIDRIEVFENGYFLGEVRQIPHQLARVNATLQRGRPARLDRDLFIIGDPDAGFELISTRHYGGFVYNHYRRSHGYRAGFLDFRRGRVRAISRSRFFDPFDFRGVVPIYLLPEDEVWLGDYGYAAPSRYWYGDDDVYFYGYAPNGGYGESRSDGAYGRGAVPPRASTSGRPSSDPQLRPLQRSNDETFRTESGAEIRIKREVSIERVD